MSARPLHPLACRIGRAERASVVAFARAQGLSVSGLMKTALRQYLAAQPAFVAPPAVTTQPVNGGVNRLQDSLASPSLLRPYRLPRAPQSRTPGAVGGERKGWLSDF